MGRLHVDVPDDVIEAWNKYIGHDLENAALKFRFGHEALTRVVNDDTHKDITTTIRQCLNRDVDGIARIAAATGALTVVESMKAGQDSLVKGFTSLAAQGAGHGTAAVAAAHGIDNVSIRLDNMLGDVKEAAEAGARGATRGPDEVIRTQVEEIKKNFVSHNEYSHRLTGSLSNDVASLSRVVASLSSGVASLDNKMASLTDNMDAVKNELTKKDRAVIDKSTVKGIVFEEELVDLIITTHGDAFPIVTRNTARDARQKQCGDVIVVDHAGNKCIIEAKSYCGILPKSEIDKFTRDVRAGDVNATYIIVNKGGMHKRGFPNRPPYELVDGRAVVWYTSTEAHLVAALPTILGMVANMRSSRAACDGDGAKFHRCAKGVISAYNSQVNTTKKTHQVWQQSVAQEQALKTLLDSLGVSIGDAVDVSPPLSKKRRVEITAS